MKNNKVSVIVPVYNVEKYLKKCMDSIVNQSYQNLEIICVNDGSTDNSLSILKSYAREDQRIKIINQENKGIGASRNHGLSVATGDYIYFIDSDDYICPDTIEDTVESAVLNDSDVVLFRYVRVKGRDRVKNKNDFYFDDDLNASGDDYRELTFNYMDAKKHVLNTYYNAWLGLYKKEFLDSWDDGYFPENIAYEDVLFHVKVFIRAKRMSHIPKIYYFYRRNPTSVMADTSYNTDIFKVIDSVVEFLIDNDLYGDFKDEIDLFKITQALFYVVDANSEEFFQCSKNLFSEIKLSPNHQVSSYKLKLFNMVLESKDYTEFLRKFYNYKLSTSQDQVKKLKNENSKLSKDKAKLNKRVKTLTSKNKSLKSKNASLRKLNNSILNSHSWKITKPLRKVVSTLKKLLGRAG